MLEWWREFEANIQAADRSLERQQQAAIQVGQPWPPARHPAVQPEAEPGRSAILQPGPDRSGERAARLDELQAQADDAAARIQAQWAELGASSEYTARMDRQAQAEPEPQRQAEAPAQIEIEPQ